MGSNLTARFLSLLFVCLIVSPAFGQKIKIKKEVVHLDKKPAFQFLKLEGSISQSFVWAIVTMEGDTTVKFDPKTIYLPKYPHESKALSMLYYEVSFAGTAEKVVMKYGVGTFRKTLSRQLLKDQVLNAKGEVQTENIEKFAKATNEGAELLNDFKDRITNREQILANEEHVKYMKTLEDRNPDNDLMFDGDKIKWGVLEIGFAKKESDNNYGTLFRVYSKRDKQYVASIFYEKDKDRTFIRTIYDDGEHEFFFKPQKTPGVDEGSRAGRMLALMQTQNSGYTWYPRALKWLVENGYF